MTTFCISYVALFGDVITLLLQQNPPLIATITPCKSRIARKLSHLCGKAHGRRGEARHRLAYYWLTVHFIHDFIGYWRVVCHFPFTHRHRGACRELPKYPPRGFLFSGISTIKLAITYIKLLRYIMQLLWSQELICCSRKVRISIIKRD
jgi:hypothetical protein